MVRKLAKLDYEDKDIDDADNPEWTAEDFARAKPFKEVFPQQYAAWKKQRGRPPIETPKKHISFRLDADVVDAVRASGPGYNMRVEKALRAMLDAKDALRDKERAIRDKERALRAAEKAAASVQTDVPVKRVKRNFIIAPNAKMLGKATSINASKRSSAAPKKQRTPRKRA